MTKKADIGMIGLAVMGENLSLNMENKGFTVAVWNYETEVVDKFVTGRGTGKKFIPTHTLEELVQAIERPRKIMMMIRAGNPVDSVIENITPLLDKGDILIDGGNSNYFDTIRRYELLKAKGIHFVGSGVSGGEEGALNGPSLMPGGANEAWKEIKPVFQGIAAKLEDGTPCCDWVGESGAGHFVKMVHNGIEYGDMQLITEAYHLMREVLHLSADELSEVFAEWNTGELNSYLIEISSEIFKHKDADGKPLVDKILDRAGQKGTGKWTVNTALDMGIPLTLISESVFARALSAQKDERVVASTILKGSATTIAPEKKQFLDALKNALYASKIISYAQGYALLREAAKEYNWNLNYGGIALMWRGGCIIRSAFLGKINEAYINNPALQNLLLDPFFTDKINTAQAGWRSVVAAAVTAGIPVPALSSALAYYDGYRTANLPSNLLQAQRDYFGAHTYERTDKPRGEAFHTNWTGHGGSTSSTTYNV
ncbi:MAG: decarboxylating NADP(+)-dependent phosphogluconate dehydrogenase [Paludibacteraceae bacterium]|nr:decarboxylating NADP(+)-dependent phosphogluconate dehydrogenase [Paludibacteraceae bacterium]